MADVVWTVTRSDLTGAERCRLVATADGTTQLAGVAVALLDGAPTDIVYAITVDDVWHVRQVTVTVDTLGNARRLELTRDADGSWHRDGVAAPDLAGCIDVDLDCSPATNTLPIRRLALDVGAAATVPVAWIRLPSLDIDVVEQRYHRLAEHRWRYAAGTFTADILVDSDGVVVAYGRDLWRRAGATADVAAPGGTGAP